MNTSSKLRYLGSRSKTQHFNDKFSPARRLYANQIRYLILNRDLRSRNQKRTEEQSQSPVQTKQPLNIPSSIHPEPLNQLGRRRLRGTSRTKLNRRRTAQIAEEPRAAAHPAVAGWGDVVACFADYEGFSWLRLRVGFIYSVKVGRSSAAVIG